MYILLTLFSSIGNLIGVATFAERGGEKEIMGQGLVIRSLNILLGLFFMFLGSLKITPNIIRDLHKDLRSEYAKYAKVSCQCQFLKFNTASSQLGIPFCEDTGIQGSVKVVPQKRWWP